MPKEMNAREIKEYLSYYGIVSIIAWQYFHRTKVAYIQISSSLEQRETSLRENWSVHLDQEKTYRVTPERFNLEELEERSRFKATIYNIPKIALDSLFLRQLKKYKVQAVHILTNRNGNQSRRAHIYFKNEEDLVLAQKSNIYYYNTKLE